MQTYTVNGIRTTLYSIIQNVFTPSFVKKYENNVTKYRSNAASIMYDESARADMAIIQMSLFLDSPAMLDSISKKLTAKTIFTIYIRYYYLSRYLEKKEQSELLELPEDKKEFFKYLLINYWQNSLPK